MRNKKITRSGSITIPAELRRDYGIQPGEHVSLDIDMSGRIVIGRDNGACIFCGTDKDLVIYRGRYVCRDCANAIKEDFDHE